MNETRLISIALQPIRIFYCILVRNFLKNKDEQSLRSENTFEILTRNIGSKNCLWLNEILGSLNNAVKTKFGLNTFLVKT